MTNRSGCLSNIGELEKRKRLLFGWTMLGVAAVAAFSLHANPVKIFRLILFIPLFFACLGFIQFKENICVYYGFRGSRNLDVGEEKIEDQKQSNLFRKNSVKVLLLSAGIALALTLVFLLIP